MSSGALKSAHLSRLMPPNIKKLNLILKEPTSVHISKYLTELSVKNASELRIPFDSALTKMVINNHLEKLLPP